MDVKQLQKLFAKSVQQELGKDYDQAFLGYVQTAQGYITLLKDTNLSTIQRSDYKALSTKAIQRADKIKTLRKGKEPVRLDPFSPDAQDRILDQGARLQNGLLVLKDWSDYLSTDLPISSASNQARVDKMLLPNQKWKRLVDFGKPYQFFTPPTPEEHVVQQVLADCSVVASLEALLQHDRSFGTQLAWSPLYPKDASGQPAISKSGTYACRFYINGRWRQVVVDDRLPVDEDGNLCCARTTRNALWPALIEKAYLQLTGGYDYHGSDPGTDLQILIGGIPQAIRLRSSQFEREKCWAQLLHASEAGQCVLLAGTARDEHNYLRAHGLQERHSYTLSRPREKDAARLLTLYNPWSTDPATAAAAEISYEELCGHFETLFMCWLPQGLFQTPRHSCVFTVAQDDVISFDILPSPECLADSNTPVYVLLHRHETVSTDVDISMDIRREHPTNTDSFKSLSIRGDSNLEYTNSRNVLKRLPTPLEQKNYRAGIICSLQASFTLSIYSACDVSCTAVSSAFVHKRVMDGRWPKQTIMKETGMDDNPQYLITTETAGVQLAVSLRSAVDRPLHMMALLGDARHTNPTARDILADTGAFCHGKTSLEIRMQGQACILSCRSIGEEDSFSMTILSSAAVEIKEMPCYGAGLLAYNISGLWQEASQQGHKLKCTSSATLHVRLEGSTAPAAFRIFSIDKLSQDSQALPLYDTTEFRTGAILSPAIYCPYSSSGWLLVPSFQSHTNVAYKFRVYCDQTLAMDI